MADHQRTYAIPRRTWWLVTAAFATLVLFATSAFYVLESVTEEVCHGQNEIRGTIVVVFDSVIATSPPPGQDYAGRAERVKEFQQFYRAKFAPIECD